MMGERISGAACRYETTGATLARRAVLMSAMPTGHGARPGTPAAQHRPRRGSPAHAPIELETMTLLKMFETADTRENAP